MGELVVPTLPLGGVVEELAKSDPAWLGAARREAWSRWESLPLPARSEHLWRYTDPERLLPGTRTPQLPSKSFGDLPDDFHDGIFENASAYAVCRDGALLRSTIDPMLASRGLVIADLRDAARSHADIVRPGLFSLAADCDGAGAKFDAL